MSIELEGLEPKVRDGKLVGYTIMPGNGPTQIANMINDPVIQKELGYTLQKPMDWKDVVTQNILYYKEAGHWGESDMLDINNPVYGNMNSNKDEELTFNLNTTKPLYSKTKIFTRNSTSTGFASSASAEAGAGAGFDIGIMSVSISPTAEDWSAGDNFTVTTRGVNASTPGAEVSAVFGKYSTRVGISSQNEIELYSSETILNKPNGTLSTSVITPLGVGGKVVKVIGGSHYINMGGIAVGIPGWSGSASGTEGRSGSVTRDDDNFNPMESLTDSLRKAQNVLRNNPGSKYFKKQVNELFNRGIKNGEIEKVKP